MSTPSAHRHRVIVIGGGFAGLQAVRKLRRAPVEITLIDRRNFHLFQPLVYQVATGSLSAEEVAAPLRSVFRRSKNVHVVLGNITRLDLSGRHVVVDRLPNGGEPRELPYDSLIVAAGSSYSYFGHDEWRPFAPDIKSI
jgi:NADH:ubiquinone reductase (H+-translocating)